METEKIITLLDNGNTRSILRFPFMGIENAYIIVSFQAEKISKAHIDLYTKYQEPFCPREPMVSFFYAGPNQGAEWSPQNYGPIMLYTKCSTEWKGETELMKAKLKPKEHWFYEYVEDNALSWSQLAVDDERLTHKLAVYDYAGIFRSLKKWATRWDGDSE